MYNYNFHPKIHCKTEECIARQLSVKKGEGPKQTVKEGRVSHERWVGKAWELEPTAYAGSTIEGLEVSVAGVCWAMRRKAGKETGHADGDTQGLVSHIISGPYLGTHGKAPKGFQWEDVSHSWLRSLPTVLRMCWGRWGEQQGEEEGAIQNDGQLSSLRSWGVGGRGGGWLWITGKAHEAYTEEWPMWDQR